MNDQITGRFRVLCSVTDARTGGPQRRILDVADKLRDRGIESEMLLPAGQGEFADTARTRGFRVHEITLSRIRPPTEFRGNFRFFVDYIPSVKCISSIIRERDIDIVHANMPVNFQTVHATVRTDVPLAWHFNDTSTPTPVKQAAAHLGVRYADELVVAADAVHDYYFGSKTFSRTVHAPVDVDRFDPTRVDVDEATLRADLGLPRDVPIVGTIGNINPIKGHEYLLRAAAEVIEDGQDIVVPIVGSKLESRKDYFQRLKALRADLGLDDRVRFLGFCSDIPEILSILDVFVLPSIAEACPVVVLEAMAMNCPVVATDVGGVREEIPNDEYGWVVPSKDSSAIASAIQEALNDPPECERRAANARSRVTSEFSLSRCVDRHEDLYVSIVNSK